MAKKEEKQENPEVEALKEKLLIKERLYTMLKGCANGTAPA